MSRELRPLTAIPHPIVCVILRVGVSLPTDVLLRQAHLGVNETRAIVLEWRVQDRSYVEQHSVLCEVESTKATWEVSEPAEGFIRVLASPGEEVPFTRPIALIVNQVDEDMSSYIQPSPTPLEASHTRATAKAQELARASAVNLTVLSNRGIITDKTCRITCNVPIL